MAVPQTEPMRKRTNQEERRSDLAQQLVVLLPKMRDHAMALTRSAQAIDDLVQETCKEVLAKLDQFRGDGRFHGWVSTTMHNIWLQGLRKKRQRGEQELPDPDQVAGANLEDQLLARDMLVALGAEISSSDFLLLIKMHVYGYTSVEIAEELGISDGTVRSRASRALKALEEAGWTAKGPPE